MTKIAPCSCVSKFQDRTYGQGKRVWNRGSEKWRCTVCGATEKIERAPKKEEK